MNKAYFIALIPVTLRTHMFYVKYMPNIVLNLIIMLINFYLGFVLEEPQKKKGSVTPEQSVTSEVAPKDIVIHKDVM